MTDTIRGAIWAARSREEQSVDQISIEKQVENCREYMARMGIVETCPPFIADGFSRSFYEGLSDAMHDIPPLADAMRAGDSNQYDVLFCYYFDRFRTVAYSVYIHLGKVRKQLRSITEMTPIIPPNLYQFEKDTITATMIHLHGIKNDAQIGRIIVQKKEAMPGRIKKGLTPSRTPYGYMNISSKLPPQQIPEKIDALERGRQMLLNGFTYMDIGKVLGVHYASVPGIYSNTFYMGEVVYNKSYVQRLGKKKIQIPLPRSKWTVGRGQHTPVWTKAEYDDLQAELARRDRGETRQTLFNKLLVCDTCGGRLHKDVYRGLTNRTVFSCRVGNTAHLNIEYEKFFNITIDAIANELKREETGESEQDDEEKVRQLLDKQDDIQRRRRMIQEGYEAKEPLYTFTEATRLISGTNQETENVTKELERIAMSRQAQRQADRVMASVDWQYAREFFAEGNPGVINQLLTAWLKEIRVANDTVKIIKR